MGNRIESFEELDVYQLAVELQQNIFELTKAFPKDETYSLTDQVRRSYSSEREQNETRHWLKSARLCDYLAEEFVRLIGKYKTIGRKLGHMMQHADQWVLEDRNVA